MNKELIEQPRHTRFIHSVRKLQPMFIGHTGIIDPSIRPIAGCDVVVALLIRERQHRLHPKPREPIKTQDTKRCD